MRDYVLMRQIMALAAEEKEGNRVNEFFDLGNVDQVALEISRLTSDKLLESDLKFDCSGMCVGGLVGNLTDEGKEFFRLIENAEVWIIILTTLEKANIDVSYPLLKEVCEEIVKRYVSNFIPEL